MSELAEPPHDGKMLKAALGYAQRGWPVFPLAPGGKVPLISKEAGGQGFIDASTDALRIRPWWEKQPDANIGFVPGGAGLVAIDIDGPQDHAKALAAGVPAEDLGPTPQTLVSQTGRAEGGRHLFYRVPQGTVIPNDPKLGITVRCKGGYVVLPPSVHPSGRPYRWLTKCEPAPCPPALLARLTGARPDKTADIPLLDTIPAGERNDTLTSYAGRLLAKGLTEAETLELLRALNAFKTAPSHLPDSEVRAIVAGIAAREREKATAPATPFPTLRVLEGDAPEPPAVLVDDLIVDRDINVWGGYGGAGKSVLALSLAICVALGRPVFGRYEARRAGPVLLVCPEDGQAALRMMLDALVGGLELDAEERATVAARLVVVPDDQVVNLCRDSGRLRDTAKECGALLVVLDPLRNLLAGAEENDNGVASAVIDALRRDVCREAGAAVLILHHFRKPGKDQGVDAEDSVHSLSGGGAWAAGARLVFAVTKKFERITMTGLKANRLRTDLRHELDLTIDSDPAMPTTWRSCKVTDRDAGGEGPSAVGNRNLTSNEEAALEALADVGDPAPRLSYSRWLRLSELKEGAFNKIRKRLMAAGFVDAEDTGKRTPIGTPVLTYGITNPGRTRLEATRF